METDRVAGGFILSMLGLSLFLTIATASIWPIIVGPIVVMGLTIQFDKMFN